VANAPWTNVLVLSK